MGDFQGLSNVELIRVINDEADKKGLSPDNVFCAVEQALEIAAKKKYGSIKLKINIDRKTGAISLLKQVMVVEDGTNNRYIYDTDNNDIDVASDTYETIKISEANTKYPDKKLEIGSIILENLPNVDLGRLAVRSAKYSIFDLIKNLEQEKQYQKYKDRIGDVIIGSVRRRVTKGGTIIDLGDAEAYLPTKNTLKSEDFRQGDRIKAIIDSVKRDDKNSQIILSRTSNDFFAALFNQEVPEIYDGIIKIHAIAREPGSKAKIAVHSVDKNIDPVGACIGIRSSRIKSIIQELNGEKIDIIIYSENIAEFVINSIIPATAIKAIIDEEKHSIELIVEQEQLSLAIGKKGQNVRLTSELVGWNINILSESDASKKKLEEFSSNTELLVRTLNVEEIIAQLLITEGYMLIEDIAVADITKLSTIEGFDINIANEILKRAQDYLQSNSDSPLKKLQDVDSNDITVLHEHGIKDLEILAELSKEEFYDIVKNHHFSDKKISDMIMSARTQLGWFEK
ncbi:MAG: transcription termination factor NusA [Rickettsiaceae bacterium H1]|nr:transcription termination factor NusA [Rickettsiaceae bacterium H1]